MEKDAQLWGLSWAQPQTSSPWAKGSFRQELGCLQGVTEDTKGFFGGRRKMLHLHFSFLFFFFFFCRLEFFCWDNHWLQLIYLIEASKCVHGHTHKGERKNLQLYISFQGHLSNIGITNFLLIPHDNSQSRSEKLPLQRRDVTLLTASSPFVLDWECWEGPGRGGKWAPVWSVSLGVKIPTMS